MEVQFEYLSLLSSLWIRLFITSTAIVSIVLSLLDLDKCGGCLPSPKHFFDLVPQYAVVESFELGRVFQDQELSRVEQCPNLQLKDACSISLICSFGSFGSCKLYKILEKSLARFHAPTFVSRQIECDENGLLGLLQ